MKVGLVGIGKLGSALIKQWGSKEIRLGIYHPDSQKTMAITKEFPHCNALALAELSALDVLILALPADRIIPFIQELKLQGISLQKPVVINMATSLQTAELSRMFPELQWMGMKLMGSSVRLKEAGNGLFITETGAPTKQQQEAIDLYEVIGHVIHDLESTIEHVNQVATYYAIKAGKEIEKAIRSEKFRPEYEKAALASVAAEVIRSYANGKLGHFAQKIADQVAKDMK
jgi:pyrroline-5-carboxylate reductase